MPAAIQIERVSKRFRDTVALDEVSFVVPESSIFGLLGPNGAGKTTLMRILVGILGPDEGQIEVTGGNQRRLKERIGYLPEERGLYQKMKVRDVLEYMATIKGLSRSEARQRIEAGLERVGVVPYADKKIGELSKGNQQRVQLLTTLLHQPDLLVLDEPFTGLDPIGVDQMKEILLQETARGATVIISTHRMEDAEEMCQNIALLHQGRVICDGSLERIKQAEGRDELLVGYEGDASPSARVEGISVIEQTDSTLRLRIENGRAVPEIVRDLSVCMELHHVERCEPALHDIFVRLVGGEERS